jgi:hypothetical protein
MLLAHVSVIFFLVHAGLTVGANGQGEDSLRARHDGGVVKEWIRGQVTQEVQIAKSIYSDQMLDYVVDIFHQGLIAPTKPPE